VKKLPRCKFCGKAKHPPKVKNHPAMLQWRLDPYCSRRCCETDLARKAEVA
jgi:hypothetical protein